MTKPFIVRRAGPADAETIASAHLDSIHAIGPLYYAPEIVGEWGARVSRFLYLPAMARGEEFFIAIGDVGAGEEVLGFSSHCVDDGQHRTAVYVRGRAARRGIGSALFERAQAAAMATGATAIDIDASLAAVEFYLANGFEEVGRGHHRLSSGQSMPCVFMRKRLTPHAIQ